MTKGWYGDRHRHSMASRGIRSSCGCKTKIIPEIRFIGTGRSSHGTMDRSWDEYLFEDENGHEISVTIFTEPDWDSVRDEGYDIGIRSDYDSRWEMLTEKAEKEFNENGEVMVVWSGGLDFVGTEKEFTEQYPELNRYLDLRVEGILDTVVSSMIPYLVDGMMNDDKEKK